MCFCILFIMNLINHFIKMLWRQNKLYKTWYYTWRFCFFLKGGWRQTAIELERTKLQSNKAFMHRALHEQWHRTLQENSKSADFCALPRTSNSHILNKPLEQHSTTFYKTLRIINGGQAIHDTYSIKSDADKEDKMLFGLLLLYQTSIPLLT